VFGRLTRTGEGHPAGRRRTSSTGRFGSIRPRWGSRSWSTACCTSSSKWSGTSSSRSAGPTSRRWTWRAPSRTPSWPSPSARRCSWPSTSAPGAGAVRWRPGVGNEPRSRVRSGTRRSAWPRGDPGPWPSAERVDHPPRRPGYTGNPYSFAGHRFPKDPGTLL